MCGESSVEDLLAIIFAPFIAFFEALAGLILAIATILGEIFGFFFELVLLALFKGLTPAKERFREGPRKANRDPGPIAKVFYSTLFLLFIAVGITFLVRYGIEYSRTTRTQQQVDALADAYIAQLEKQEAGELVPGPSDQQDAWDNTIEIRENDFVVGTQVVVQSNGPDGKLGSNDDISAIRYHKTTAKEIRDHFVGKAVGKWEELLAEHDQEEEVEIDLQDEVPNAQDIPEHDPTDAPLSDQPKSNLEQEEKTGWKLPSFKIDWGKKDE